MNLKISRHGYISDPCKCNKLVFPWFSLCILYILTSTFARMTLRLRKISRSYKEIKKAVRKDEVKENYAEMRVAARR